MKAGLRGLGRKADDSEFGWLQRCTDLEGVKILIAFPENGAGNQYNKKPQ